MENKPKLTPKDFFLHGGTIVALYTVVISFLNLVFALINKIYPPIEQYYYSNTASALSWPMAVLIIVFPVLLLLSWLLKKDFATDPMKKELGLRKWLIYATLFIAGIVLVGDLVTVLYTFLNGEILTIGFILKALAVLLVIGAVFIYYILELKGKTTGKVNQIAFWGSLIVVLALIIGSFVVLGSPRTQRLVKLDEQKINDLHGIQWQIVQYWQSKGELPDVLNDLNDPLGGFVVPRDSQLNQSYEYEIVSPNSFRLCAEFNLESAQDQNYYLTYPVVDGIDNSINWQHAEGRQCFERTIDADLFPIGNGVKILPR